MNIETLYKCDVPVDGIVVSVNSAEYKLVYRLINLLNNSITYFMGLYRGSPLISYLNCVTILYQLIII